MNWDQLPGPIWQVVPASGNVMEPQTGPTRNKNSIGTKCMYSDFRLSFEFRCPNMRAVFTICNGMPNVLKGPQNWGNSGVKILAPKGYEIQIMDSYEATSTFVPAGTRDPNGTTDLGTCRGQKGGVKVGDVCGAIYHTWGPASNTVLPAINDPAKPLEYVPDGLWNTMFIEFMAARYKKEGTEMKKVKCSTVSVTLNSVLIQDRIGLSPVGWGAEFTEKERLICDEVYDTPGDPKAYCKASGIILFQEHDTPVQFQKIEIDPTWKPMSGGSFYESWQRFEPPAGTCKPRV